jgi:hypothetical protein
MIAETLRVTAGLNTRAGFKTLAKWLQCLQFCINSESLQTGGIVKHGDLDLAPKQASTMN